LSAAPSHDYFEKPENPLKLLEKGDLSSSYKVVQPSKYSTKITSENSLPEITIKLQTPASSQKQSESAMRGQMFDFRLSKKDGSNKRTEVSVVNKKKTLLEPILEN
jgi:hypothetical protein